MNILVGRSDNGQEVSYTSGQRGGTPLRDHAGHRQAGLRGVVREGARGLSAPHPHRARGQGLRLVPAARPQRSGPGLAALGPDGRGAVELRARGVVLLTGAARPWRPWFGRRSPCTSYGLIAFGRRDHGDVAPDGVSSVVLRRKIDDQLASMRRLAPVRRHGAHGLRREDHPQLLGQYSTGLLHHHFQGLDWTLQVALAAAARSPPRRSHRRLHERPLEATRRGQPERLELAARGPARPMRRW